MADDQDVRHIKKNELFETLEERDSSLKRCEKMDIGSQRLAKERRYRIIRKKYTKGNRDIALWRGRKEVRIRPSS